MTEGGGGGGGGGVQNSLNLCDVIYERPLTTKKKRRHFVHEPTVHSSRKL